ncbi:MAG: prolyl aminopeptidase [Alphaproteobacteria bacterium]|nr:prolyl aminopeptidase [Alphaproteobacteria bacterium]MBU1552660.1 prolyl aminopeptidase [Alphaproteobacteria bacterium]MBU2339309.1 prolyl aminopeptidase [Alphaproteobacteria bacterium]MBU2390021.1 prolyl aminopeptidase [Alphaproteobacteria bacterium]
MQEQGLEHSFYVQADSLHRLYVEEHGSPTGIPVVVLHGGPGAGMSRKQIETFDPSAFRIIIFDQRGAGQSTPHADLRDNTTAKLIADLELLRAQLGIERWLVSGGSWGSCLALAYAQAHPDRCLGLRLHGIFLAGRDDIDWWFNGVRAIFPDEWEAFSTFIPEGERHDLLSAYHRRLTSGNADEETAAALSLRGFSARTQTFLPDPDHVAALMEPKAALAVARLFTHYCINDAFLAPGQLLQGVDRVRHLPCEIVQGRYDTVTPMASAWRLHRAWPEAGFTVVTEANHQSTKGPLFEELKRASERLHAKLCIGGQGSMTA